MNVKQYTSSLQWIFLILFRISLHLSQCKCENQSFAWNEAINVLQGNTYNRYLKPEEKSGNATVVSVNVYVETAGLMNNKDIPMNVIVTGQWQDRQLALKELSQGSLLFKENLLSFFWKPNLYLASTGAQHDNKVYSEKIILKPNGHLTLCYRVKFHVSCQTHLQLFPLDGHICTVKIRSFYYPAEELQLKWQNDTDWHKSMSKIEIDNFNLESITLIEGNISQLGQNWSQIEAKLHLKRNFSLPILAIYITSSILVIVGGLSFWIDSESTAARMSLGLITLLTLITHNSSLHPEKHYFVTGVLGIDIWLIICLIFVFSALFQFIILSHSISSHSTKSKSKKIPSSHDSLATGEQENSSNRMVIERDVNKYKIKDSEPTNTDTTTNKADRFCRVCFPLAFILTNIIYWMLHFY